MRRSHEFKDQERRALILENLNIELGARVRGGAVIGLVKSIDPSVFELVDSHDSAAFAAVRLKNYLVDGFIELEPFTDVLKLKHGMTIQQTKDAIYVSRVMGL